MKALSLQIIKWPSDIRLNKNIKALFVTLLTSRTDPVHIFCSRLIVGPVMKVMFEL